MRAILRHRPSPAMVIACIALAVALGGTSYAAISLPAGSVGTKQLKKNAITSPKVKNNGITGADVLESSLRRVPLAAGATNAAKATTATNAGHASDADHATSATSAVVANDALSKFEGLPISFPDNDGVDILALYIPAAGKYVITAKLRAYNSSGTESPDNRCRLTTSDLGGVGVDHDDDFFRVEGNGGSERVFLQIVHHFTAPGLQIDLQCTDNGVGNVSGSYIRITAVRVAQLTDIFCGPPDTCVSYGP
jgi:hypothetical protein